MAMLRAAAKACRASSMLPRPSASLAVKNRVIDEASERQAGLAKDARNLIHPGKALRSGEACNKTTALTALTAVYRVIDGLMGTG
jgi:hypothetical protein